MAMKTISAFASGVVVGWVARSAVGPGREVLVEVIALGHRIADRARRGVASRVEWIEDALAEGRARYEAVRDIADLDPEAPAQVDSRRDRERAA